MFRWVVSDPFRQSCVQSTPCSWSSSLSLPTHSPKHHIVLHSPFLYRHRSKIQQKCLFHRRVLCPFWFDVSSTHTLVLLVVTPTYTVVDNKLNIMSRHNNTQDLWDCFCSCTMIYSSTLFIVSLVFPETFEYCLLSQVWNNRNPDLTFSIWCNFSQCN